jgi:uncharacterized protein (TIGR02996 family)
VHDEADFLRKLLESPADDTVRLVFADWLDERADDESRTKAAFLRLTARLLDPNHSPKLRKVLHAQTQSLAAELPTDWLAVVSRLQVEGCPTKAEEHAHDPQRRMYIAFFKFTCDMRWDEMTPTQDDSVRRCAQCDTDVHYCDTLTVARSHAAQGHCVAVDLGVIRREDDLAPHRMWVGMPSDETVRQEEERWQLDPVSLEREERKQKQKTASAS